MSGEHDSDAFNFVEVAMKKIGKSGLTIAGCYYFFKICDENPDVDVHHSVTMDDALRGNSDDTKSSSDDEPLKNRTRIQDEKKRAYAAISDISGVAKSIAEEIKETNRLAQESTDVLKEKNRLQQETTNTLKQTSK